MVALIISPDGSGGSRRHPSSSLDGIEMPSERIQSCGRRHSPFTPRSVDLPDTGSGDRLAVLIFDMNDERCRRFEHDVDLL